MNNRPTRTRVFIAAGIFGAIMGIWLSFGPVMADNLIYFSTPTKSIGPYNMYGSDAGQEYSSSYYCPSPTPVDNEYNGCWDVYGSTLGEPGASFYDTQEVGEDMCYDLVDPSQSKLWLNGPNTGHSYSQNTAVSVGPIMYDCQKYVDSSGNYFDHRYCLKSYHRTQWGQYCLSSNCLLENSFVYGIYSGSNDTTSNPGC